MELKGKVALVTGGGRRVGRALALALAERGAAVAVHYNESDAGATQVVAEIEKAGGRAKSFGADLTDGALAQALLNQVASQLGGLDVLVNSAAIMKRTPFGETTAESFDEILDLNL